MTYGNHVEKQIEDQKKRKEKERQERKIDWWEVRQAAQPSHVAGLYNEETKVKGEEKLDPWETKRRYEEDLRKQMEMKRKREEYNLIRKRQDS